MEDSNLASTVAEEDYEGIVANLERITQSQGWRAAQQELTTTLESIWPVHWFAKNRILSHIMNMPELVGYTGDMLDAFKYIRETSDFERVISKAQGKGIALVQAQLKRGGPAGFFDVESMKTRKSAILVPFIVKARSYRFSKIAPRCLKEISTKGITSKTSEPLASLCRCQYGHAIASKFEDSSIYEIERLKSTISGVLEGCHEVEDIEDHPTDEDERMELLLYYLSIGSKSYESWKSERIDYLIKSGFFNSQKLLLRILKSIEKEKAPVIDIFGPLEEYEDQLHLIIPLFEDTIERNIPALEEVAGKVLTFDLRGCEYYGAKIHWDALDILERKNANKEAVVEFIRSKEWDCDIFDSPSELHVNGTSSAALDKALGLALKMGESKEVARTCRFFIGDGYCSKNLLRWYYGGPLRGIIVDRLVEAEGIDAAPLLVKYLDWYEDRGIVGSGIMHPDYTVIEALLEIGPDVVPFVKDSICGTNCYVSEGAVLALQKLGDVGFQAIMKHVIDGCCNVMPERCFNKLWKPLPEGSIYRKMASLIARGMGMTSDSEIQAELDQAYECIDEHDLLYALNSDYEYLRRQACFRIPKRLMSSDKIASTIRRMLTEETGIANTVMYAAEAYGPEMFDAMWERFSNEIVEESIEDEPYEAFWYFLDDYGEVAIKLIANQLESQFEKRRNAVLVFIGRFLNHSSTESIITDSIFSEMGEQLRKALESSSVSDSYRTYIANVREFVKSIP